MVPLPLHSHDNYHYFLLVQVDEDGVNVEGMGAEATIRIQRARINVLQKQLKDSLDERATMSKRVTDMESEMKR